MAEYNQGDIVLVPFPHADEPSVQKKRPVVIVSSNKVNGYLYIVAKITSALRKDETCFSITSNDINGELKKESEIRTNEIHTIHKSLIIKRFSSLKRDSFKELTGKIKEIFTID